MTNVSYYHLSQAVKNNLCSYKWSLLFLSTFSYTCLGNSGLIPGPFQKEMAKYFRDELKLDLDRPNHFTVMGIRAVPQVGITTPTSTDPLPRSSHLKRTVIDNSCFANYLETRTTVGTWKFSLSHDSVLIWLSRLHSLSTTKIYHSLSYPIILIPTLIQSKRPSLKQRSCLLK